jgi:SMI1 / KNR4 family (SUKH-1)
LLEIGTRDWLRTLMAITAPLGSDFWSDFKPATESELQRTEKQIGRKLDPEFREFYRTVGYGMFPDGGGFYAPHELVQGAGPAIYFITGSLTPGDEWASEEQHTRLWLTRGRENPNPERFTDEVLTLEGVKLYDLLQFGSNGCCCYHQLYLGPEPAPLRYCLLTDCQEMEDRAMSFSEGLEKLLAFRLLDE